MAGIQTFGGDHFTPYTDFELYYYILLLYNVIYKFYLNKKCVP